MTARSRLISTWIAVWAIVLNALLPTVSLAFEPANKQINSASADWVEICTSRGSTWVQLGLDGQVLAQTNEQPEGAPAATHNGHCPYCLTHAASFGLLPVSAMVLPVRPAVTELLPQRSPPATGSRVWLAPAALAPPASA